MHGYADKILTFDLSSGRKSLLDLDEMLIRKYLGGRGFVSYWMYENIDQDTEPQRTRRFP